jgi:hypothetical protein
MSINLDQHDTRELPVISSSRPQTSPVRVDFPVTLEPHTPRGANDQAPPSARRTVVLGCLAVLGILAVGLAVSSLDARPLAECRSGPVRLRFGSETTAAVTTGAGVPCAISLVAPGASIDDLKVAMAARHGTIAPRGRTGVTYRPDVKYRGEDSFDLALRGRADSGQGFAIVRVQVNVR